MSTWFSILTYNNPIHGLDISPYVEKDVNEGGELYLTDNCSSEYTEPTNAVIINYLALNYPNCKVTNEEKDLFYDFYHGGLSYLFINLEDNSEDYYFNNNSFGIIVNTEIDKNIIFNILYNNFIKYKHNIKGIIINDNDLKNFLKNLIIIRKNN